MFESRRIEHDKQEAEVMDIVRPYTTRRHLPDRWVSFGDTICAFDVKTNCFVENRSHDEYFRCLAEDVPVAIVYRNGKTGDKYGGDGELHADWIYNLTWHGPFAASSKSTTGDNYYRISGGRLLADWLQSAGEEVKR